ncbi:MAG: ferritin [Phycisphaerales bacterium]|nr:MAG: ferritin [Phycisphaerales bacterium]
MFGVRLQDSFNRQINAELYSAYLYLAMSSWFDSQNFPGMASWMRIQAQEEQQHALKFYDFVQERDGRVILTAIEAPQGEWSSPLAAFEDALAHERKVTGMINDLVDLAIAEKDHAANVFLQWFVTEQVEEEATAGQIVDRLKVVADNPVALLMVDDQLGKRAPEPGAE